MTAIEGDWPPTHNIGAAIRADTGKLVLNEITDDQIGDLLNAIDDVCTDFGRYDYGLPINTIVSGEPATEGEVALKAVVRKWLESIFVQAISAE